jgi:sodium/hydrogen antiporter
METQLLLLVLPLFFYSLIAARIERMALSGPILFVAFGWLVGPQGLNWLTLDVGREELGVLAELSLALVLFTDAANADLRVLKRSFQIPERLLAIGLPLTIAAGFFAAWILFPGLAFLECAILATILAPTDAALGQAVISNKDVPARLREGLDVESGLNDGICVPALFLLLALATEKQKDKGPLQQGLELFGNEIGIGLAVGVGVVAVTLLLIRMVGSERRIPPVWRQVLVVSIGLGAYGAAQVLGGSGFIASFTGGLLFGAARHDHKAALLEAAEGTGNVLSLTTWSLFGAVIAGHYIDFQWRIILFAVLSLTILRMGPVCLALMGMKIPLRKQLFVGWFGPRGLASIVFGVIYLENALPGAAIVADTVVLTVLLSIVLHGISAVPLSRAIGRVE